MSGEGSEGGRKPLPETALLREEVAFVDTLIPTRSQSSYENRLQFNYSDEIARFLRSGER